MLAEMLETVKVRARPHLSVFIHGGLFLGAASFHLFVILLCTLLCLVTCGPCSTSRVQQSDGYDACGSHRDSYRADFQDIFDGDVTSGYYPGDSLTRPSPENVCTNSNLFCFPSTLAGCLFEEHKFKPTALEVSGRQSDSESPMGSAKFTRWTSNSSWLADYGMFKLSNGKSVSCSLNSGETINYMSSGWAHSANQNDISSCRGPVLNKMGSSTSLDRKSEMIKSSFLESSSPYIEINPPLLDWGESYLNFPSLASLTVANTCNDSILHVYEPFSTNIQFYSCNYSDFFLGPGEVASICFVFLPRWLGLSSANLILQTSSGGFVVQAKGFAIESPYGVQPLTGLDVSSSGRWSKNLSLFNPFDETLFVEEVTVWIAVSLGNTSYSTEAVCSLESLRGSDDLHLLGGKEWLDLKSGRVDLPLIAMRPHGNWEIGPGSSEAIIEIDFAFDSNGKIFGALCMQLLRSSQDKTDTVMVPLEAELGGKATFDALSGSLSVSLEALVPCDAMETAVFALSLRNLAPYLVSVVKITEVTESTKLFQIKYVEGLVLFPGTLTKIAVVTYNQPLILSAFPDMNMNSKLLILTNDSSGPQIEIPCEDIVRICSDHQLSSYIGQVYQSEKVESGNARAGSLSSSAELSSETKALDIAEADELVLGNWKSQATTNGMSVLDDHEVLFPMVQVGAHHSKWITVKNPSQQPVVIQLILNSGEIIDECRDSDGPFQPSSSGSLVRSESAAPTRYGFSMAESALTEAYVHPHGRACIGPISFHPSNRCGWRSSALIRNNLSGVEWLSLRGFGGLPSLVLLEESEPVQSLEFNLNLPIPFNISSPGLLFYKEETSNGCSQPLTKEIFAKNTGDLPLEVRRIEVSGTECGLDGFMVHTCKGFALEPGESTALLISYQADFSAATVCRDLELGLATGILVIPMKASLPMYMLNLCERSVFWKRVKKSSMVAFLAASLMFLVFCFLLPQLMALGAQDDLFKSEKSSIATTRNTGQPSRVHHNQRNSKLSVSSKMDGLLRSEEDDRSGMLGPISSYSDGQFGNQELEVTAQYVKPYLRNHGQINGWADTQKERALPSSSLSKSGGVESSDPLEASQSGDLVVRIGKDKRRKRRKRKGAGSGLTGLFEVSSSQSGNSTPSSPLSPVTSLTPKQSWSLSPDVDQHIDARNPFSHMANQSSKKGQVLEPAKANVLKARVSLKSSNNFLSTLEQPSEPRKTSIKPVAMPSTTLPCEHRPASSVSSHSPFLASSSTIALDARAPGSKLYSQKAVQAEERAEHEDEFTYDIWGDHFSGLHLIGRSKELSALISSATESNSDSFFSRGPQALVMKSQPISIQISGYGAFFSSLLVEAAQCMRPLGRVRCKMIFRS
ncbi:uncharacterized protein LOC131165788 isoform X2 [Malania oleifera]|uniref:uncharacterized protein LOC131165788 isoform X2 n=1 Tax=Malania oleifera TaxID=397392 RepID=UPI0025AE60E5|nr:uncharacterized protein LOC131165788 isoform X2 [Malania oleifera]